MSISINYRRIIVIPIISFLLYSCPVTKKTDATNLEIALKTLKNHAIKENPELTKSAFSVNVNFKPLTVGETFENADVEICACFTVIDLRTGKSSKCVCDPDNCGSCP